MGRMLDVVNSYISSRVLMTFCVITGIQRLCLSPYHCVCGALWGWQCSALKNQTAELWTYRKNDNLFPWPNIWNVGGLQLAALACGLRWSTKDLTGRSCHRIPPQISTQDFSVPLPATESSAHRILMQIPAGLYTAIGCLWTPLPDPQGALVSLFFVLKKLKLLHIKWSQLRCFEHLIHGHI